MQEVKSSMLTHVGHDPLTNQLRVRFKNGAEHIFEPVTAEEHAALLQAESIGQHFNKHIRGKKSTKTA